MFLIANLPRIPLAKERFEASSKRPSLPLLAQEPCGLNGPIPTKPEPTGQQAFRRYAWGGGRYETDRQSGTR